MAENNTVLFELSKRLRAKYDAVANTEYAYVTVEGLDGKTANLNTIIHDLQKKSSAMFETKAYSMIHYTTH